MITPYNWHVMPLFSLRLKWMPLDCVAHTVFAQSCDGHLFMILFFGYNAEMKINSKEIETALKFMPVVKINKEFNENVHRLDLREKEWEKDERVKAPYMCTSFRCYYYSRARCTAFENLNTFGTHSFFFIRTVFFCICFFILNSWGELIPIGWDTKLKEQKRAKQMRKRGSEQVS